MDSGTANSSSLSCIPLPSLKDRTPIVEKGRLNQ
jgi:hypothetical protein